MAAQKKGQAAPAAAVVRGGSSKQSVDNNNTSLGSRVRNALFPIHGDEVKKFLLIGSIKFFVILALTLTRDNKDTMVVTECGAEAIAFLKVSASMFTALYFCPIISLSPHIILLDLRSFTSCHFIHWHLLQNGYSS